MCLFVLHVNCQEVLGKYSLMFLYGYDFIFLYHRNQFPDIISTAYYYAIMQTKNFLKIPLESTGLRPHISLAVDKSTPHRDTNHAIMLLLPMNGKRIAMPLDAPPVYSIAEESNEIEGGTGEDLAKQIVNVLKEKLDFDQEHMHYVRGTMYINNMINTKLTARFKHMCISMIMIWES